MTKMKLIMPPEEVITRVVPKSVEKESQRGKGKGKDKDKDSSKSKKKK